MSCCKSVPEFKFALRDDLKEMKNFLPTRAHETDTGWDVCCAEPKGIILAPKEYAKIRLGFRMFSPPGWWVELKPRSSTHGKKHLNCLYGTIDEGYENELLLSVQFSPDESQTINTDRVVIIEFGERIGQIIPVKRQSMLVTEVSNEEFDDLCADRGGSRGTGGFGSSG